jgi:hypothetical protein
MIFRVLTACHTQYTWDSSICVFLFNRTTLQVFVTNLTGALYVHPLWFYKHQHDNRVYSKLFVACQQWQFQWCFTAILVNCTPSRKMHNYCTPHIIKENFENVLIHRCNYILLSQVYCVWQVVKTLTIILNNPVFINIHCKAIKSFSLYSSIYIFQNSGVFTGNNNIYSFCLMVEASDHGYVLHTRRIRVTRYRI